VDRNIDQPAHRELRSKSELRSALERERQHNAILREMVAAANEIAARARKGESEAHEVFRDWFQHFTEKTWRVAVLHGWCDVLADTFAEAGVIMQLPEVVAEVNVKFQVREPIEWDYATQKGLDRESWFARHLNVPSLMLSGVAFDQPDEEGGFVPRMVDPAEISCSAVEFSTPQVVAIDLDHQVGEVNDG
jgi:hypothetical protein